MILTDTHTHLCSEEFDQDRTEMIQRAISAGVSRFFIPSIDSTGTQKMYDLEAQFTDNVRLMIGLHPCYVKDNYLEELAHVEAQLAAHKFYKALQSGDANLIQPAAYLKPYDRSRFLYVAQILNENKLEIEAIKVLRDASKIYPDSFELWQQWSVITSATTTDVANAKAEMRRLDPFNPDLK